MCRHVDCALIANLARHLDHCRHSTLLLWSRLFRRLRGPCCSAGRPQSGSPDFYLIVLAQDETPQFGSQLVADSG